MQPKRKRGWSITVSKTLVGCVLLTNSIGLYACQNQETECYILGTQTQDFLSESDSATEEQTEEMTQNLICVVYVCGCVAKEGVYELPADARLMDAIEAAGGMLNEADSKALNLAEPVYDAMKIYVPKIGEEPMAEAAKQDGLLDLNQASLEELMTLPGIGKSKAESIIAYREEHGGFQTMDEIMQIPGIKDGVYQKIKEKIKVN